MRVIRSIAGMSGITREASLKNKSIGFVPTMGALHLGHLNLIRQARKENDIVAVSIFVNPTQFGPQEDFRRYPRPLEKDISLCRKEGVDFVFLPEAKDMYPQGFKTYVTVEGLSGLLCGRTRPGHFRGVATIVTKLFNIINPSVAYFGQKDAQQAIIIKRMVEDLNMAVKIKVMPTVREKCGLALSSRNLYLNPGEKEDALVLSQALSLARRLIQAGTKDASKLIGPMRQLINKKKTAKINYVSIVDSCSLKPMKQIAGGCLIVLAVWIGKTRLIDNILIKRGRFLNS